MFEILVAIPLRRTGDISFHVEMLITNEPHKLEGNKNNASLRIKDQIQRDLEFR